MRLWSGQAARASGRVLHVLCEIALALLAVGVVGASVLAWRLSQGPVDLDWLARRLEAAANADAGATRLHIGSAGLAWEGFSRGVDRPFDIRATQIVVTDAAGARLMDIPAAAVSLSLHGLLLGRLLPRAIEIDRPRITVIREANGSTLLDLGGMTRSADTPPASPPLVAAQHPLAALLTELGTPGQTDRTPARASRFAQLRLLRVHDAAISVLDRQLGATWNVLQAEIDLRRRAQGGIQGDADLTLALGKQTAHLIGSAVLAAGGAKTTMRLRLTPVSPGALASAAPRLVALAALDAPLSGEAELELGAGLALQRAKLELRAAAGALHLGGTTLALGGATLTAEGSPAGLDVTAFRVALAHPIGPPSLLRGHARLRPAEAGYTADLALDVDQVSFAELPQLWPTGVAGQGARSWVVQNITAGTARAAHVEASLALPRDLSYVTLTTARGTLAGDDVTVHWLRPIPPVEHGQAKLVIVDPDTLEITASAGRQAGTALQLRDGSVRITGLSTPHQRGTIATTVAGPLADAIAVLRQPRLQLLDRHPADLRDPAGQCSVKLSIELPLEDAVTMDAIAVRARGTLSDVHLTAIAAGRDLDHGQLALDAGNDGMTLDGRAQLAGIPAELALALDFRAGPPDQVLQKVTVSGRGDARQLIAAGLPESGMLGGAVGLQATLTERRDGRGDVAVAADLKDASVDLAPLGWSKPQGRPAKASATVRLSHDKLAGVDAIAAKADGLAIEGSADLRAGQPGVLQLSRVAIGQTSAQGEVRFGQSAGGRPAPVQMSFSGPTIDLSSRFSRRAQAAPAPASAHAAASSPAGRPWSVDARFDRALVGGGRQITGLALHAEDDGRLIQRLRLDGRIGGAQPIHLTIDPVAGGRQLAASADDAGGLLAAFGLTDTIDGGRLSVTGSYDDRQADHPLNGAATIDEFRVRNAPGLGKVLQAMSLYGLVDALSGPGLNFTRLQAPFRLTDDALDLADARAFSSSLGLTMKGRFDRAHATLDLRGTIVPAYMINSLLGRIPLLGKLFSPEKGGGLFAADYAISGPLANPRVSVNPLSALTPGALRGLFGLF